MRSSSAEVIAGYSPTSYCSGQVILVKISKYTKCLQLILGSGLGKEYDVLPPVASGVAVSCAEEKNFTRHEPFWLAFNFTASYKTKTWC